MIKKKIICILLALILITGTSIISFATDNTNLTNGQGNETQNKEQSNSINTNTSDLNELNQQKNEIQNKLEEVNNQLEYVQGEISNGLLEIQKINDKIAQYETENKQLNEKIVNLETSITETTALLQNVIQDYTQKDQQLKDRLVALYEAGEVSYLDVLLSSNSLSDFLSRYYVMQEIAEYDNELIDKVAQQKKTIETSQKKLENETAQVKIMKARAEQTEIILKNTKTMQEEYISQLSDQEKDLNEKMEKYKEDNARIESQIQQISVNINDIQIQYTGGTMIWPVAITGTKISSYYGTREHPISGIVKLHQGIDIANTGYGAPAVATLDGVVTYAGWLGSYGNCVMIYHGDGITTVYAHGQKVLKQKGEQVKQGDVVLETGSTGNSTGPHLHFEVRINGSTTNPLQFVKEP